MWTGTLIKGTRRSPAVVALATVPITTPCVASRDPTARRMRRRARGLHREQLPALGVNAGCSGRELEVGDERCCAAERGAGEEVRRGREAFDLAVTAHDDAEDGRDGPLAAGRSLASQVPYGSNVAPPLMTAAVEA